MAKAFWITDNRFKWISLLLVFIFLTFMGVVIWQGENISKNPCSLCAKKFDSNVICTLADGLGSNIVFTEDSVIENMYHWED